ncbi:MAG: glycosyltransferase [Lachnospiraceae bacterium]|nr:glycosyltransferase [Lachnospiraceae bacterium]
MSLAKRALSFMKRNGIGPTITAVAERKDQKRMDAWQKRTLGYDHAIRPRSLFGEIKTVSDQELAAIREREDILISILVPAYQTKKEYFCQMIESVLGQSYPNWQLVIADSSSDDRLRQAAESYKDPRICYHHLDLNEGISQNTNEAFKWAEGNYVGLLDHDDLLAPQALSEVVRLLRQGGYDMVYTDEDKVSADLTGCFEPNIKPAFNLDLLLSNNYICHFTVIRSELFGKALLRKEYDGAQDYDLFLRILIGIEWERVEKHKTTHEYGWFPVEYVKRHIGHVPMILYHWRAHEHSTSDNPESKRYAYEAGKRAVEDFFHQMDWDATITHSRHLGFYHAEYHPDIMTVRKDIDAVCGRSVRRGCVIKGPVMDGVHLFDGMNFRFSGYLHRAAMPLDVDQAPREVIKRRKRSSVRTSDRNAGQTEGRLVYLPDLFFREKG